MIQNFHEKFELQLAKGKKLRIFSGNMLYFKKNTLHI